MLCFFVADIDGLITRALLTGNFESAVDLCLHDNRMADAIILAIAGGQELLAQTQKKYFAKSQSKITRVCYFLKQIVAYTYILYVYIHIHIYFKNVFF